jgi:glycosyltransferase involved in cell wall biosynthesis
MLATARDAQQQDSPPDVVVVPGEDVAQLPLQAALRWGPPVAVICQTPATLPFGDGAAFPSRSRTELFRRAAIVVATSRFLADYISDATNIQARQISIPAAAPPDDLVSNELANRQFVLMINPSTIKGLPILLEVARALPDIPFLAVPTWATEPADLAELSGLPNVSLQQPTNCIYELLSAARVLLVPSLWLENVPLIIGEAMLAGVPVLASLLGGIPEIMANTGTCLPVRRAVWQREPGGSMRATDAKRLGLVCGKARSATGCAIPAARDGHFTTRGISGASCASMTQNT